MIIGRDLLTALRLDLKFSEKCIVCGDGPHLGYLELMADVTDYDFKHLMV